MRWGYSISFNPSNNPTKLVGITNKLILQVLNNWPRVSLPVGGRVRMTSRTEVNGIKFLAVISVQMRARRWSLLVEERMARSLPDAWSPMWTHKQKT